MENLCTNVWMCMVGTQAVSDTWGIVTSRRDRRRRRNETLRLTERRERLQDRTRFIHSYACIEKNLQPFQVSDNHSAVHRLNARHRRHYPGANVLAPTLEFL
uniref:Uncharacterized protein n=1 Tax=Lotharella globosa TaxID=91324 RepID=A0A6V3KLW2_9EUKA